jgi:hypothetical protein
MISSEIVSLIEQLSNKSSSKRRSAAKKLRKLNAIEAGFVLLEALKNELKDKRTWETQYQMIMALGESGYIQCLDFLTDLTKQPFEATMVHTAIGDAITTLEHRRDRQLKSLPDWIEDNKKPLVEGGIRSLAMNKIIPSDTLINKIIKYVQKPENSHIDFWTAAASPGWPPNATNKFLEDCLLHSKSEETKKAAKAALNGKYMKWNPL